MLEGVSPPLQLTHLSCQATAKAFAATRKNSSLKRVVSPLLIGTTSLVFDRMFSLGMRGNGVESQPLGARVAAVAASTGPRRHFLYCTLKNEIVTRPAKKSREIQT